MRLHQFVLRLGITGVCLLALPGCGDDAAELSCGQGTVERDGVCAPDMSACGAGTQFDEQTGQCAPSSANCARGTIADGDVCVPDGSVICDDGTTYNASSGQCQADISRCGPGTVLDGLVCIPIDDAIEASTEEAAEPNNTDGLAGELVVPNLTGSASIYGCIAPVDVDDDGSVDIDRDSFRVTSSGPTILDVSVDGIAGLSGAFVIRAASGPLADDDWSRVGLNVVSDTSRRQVFLPAAGDYFLEILDGRSLLTSEPAGGPATCYFASIRSKAIPAAVNVDDVAVGLLGSGPQFFSFSPEAEGDILVDSLQMPSPTSASSLAMVHMREGRYAGNAQGAGPLGATTGGLRLASNLIIVVEPEFNYSLDDVAYEYSLTRFPSRQISEDSATTITSGSDPGQSMAWIPVTAGEVLRLRIDDSQIRLESLDDDLAPQTELCDGCAGSEFFYQATESGLLYVGLRHLSAMLDFDVTMQVDRFTPTSLPVDAPLTGVFLGSTGFDFYEIEEAALSWTVLEAAPTNFGGPLQAVRYSRTDRGFLDFEVPAQESIQLSEGVSQAHIAENQLTSLWRLEDGVFDGTADTEIYSVSNGSLDFTVLLPSTTLNAVDIASGDEHRYLLQASPGDIVEIVASTTDALDISIRQLSEFEDVTATEDAGGIGDTETVQILIPASGHMPLMVLSSGDSGAYDLTAVLVTPP